MSITIVIFTVYNINIINIIVIVISVAPIFGAVVRCRNIVNYIVHVHCAVVSVLCLSI